MHTDSRDLTHLLGSAFGPSAQALRPDHRSTLIKRGYVVINNFISSAGVRSLLEELHGLVDSYRENSVHHLCRDPLGRVLVGNRLEKENDLLFDFARHQELVSLAAELLGKPVVPLHIEYFDKPPGSAFCAPPHQDHAFYTHFPDELAIAFWVALDPVRENGSLQFSTRPYHSLLPHTSSNEIHFDAELANAREFAFEKIMIPRGSCIAFHSMAVHRSGPNFTDRSRRAIVFNYRGSPYKAGL